MKKEDYSELIDFFEKKGWRSASITITQTGFSVDVKTKFEDALTEDLRWHVSTKGKEWVQGKLDQMKG